MDIGTQDRIGQFFNGRFCMDDIASFLFENKYLDSVEWQEVDKLQGEPIMAFGPIRNTLKPISISNLEREYFLDGSKFDSKLVHDIVVTFDAAIMLLLEQIPARLGNYISDPEGILKNHDIDIDDCYWSSSDNGKLIIGTKFGEGTHQLFVILPFEVL